ncbi:MAG: hypothetical protein M3N41_08635, partial [Acidobacteriota bacterium]|nr:hypothetical protein [Acidobacteriota bacterium]
RILADDRKNYEEHGNADDKMYDSRAGLGVFYRWQPRNMQRLCQQQNAGLPTSIHLSVLERIAHGTDGYSPGTLAPHSEVVFTPSNDPQQDAAVTLRAAAAKAAVDAAFAQSGSNLNKANGTIAIGRIAYYLYVLSCLAAILAASVPVGAGSRRNPWTILKNTATLLYDAVTAQWSPLLAALERLVTDPKLIGMLLAGFAVSAALAHYVDRKRSLVFSRYWHDARQDLRSALKNARSALLAGK